MTSLSDTHNTSTTPHTTTLCEEESSRIPYAERDRKVIKMLKNNSQNYNAYIYLRDIGSLTVDEWYKVAGATTLTQRIKELKKYGADIENVYKDHADKNFARYVLNKD